jgi:hypothetical protein
MKSENREVIEPQHWVPWLGLALVVPAFLIMLVVFFGALNFKGSGAVKDPFAGSNTAVGVLTGLFGTIGAVGGLMLAAVGVVRGLRRSKPHTGRSVGIAGFLLEIITLIIGVAALAFLGVAYL